MKLADVGDEADWDGRGADVRVVSRGAGDEVVHGGPEAVLVEEARDARVRHAAPVVRFGLVHPRDHRQPRVC